MFNFSVSKKGSRVFFAAFFAVLMLCVSFGMSGFSGVFSSANGKTGAQQESMLVAGGRPPAPFIPTNPTPPSPTKESGPRITVEL